MKARLEVSTTEVLIASIPLRELRAVDVRLIGKYLRGGRGGSRTVRIMLLLEEPRLRSCRRLSCRCQGCMEGSSERPTGSR